MAGICTHDWTDGGERGSFCTKCDKYASDLFNRHGLTLTFHFPTVALASDFKSWLCDGGGEQQWGGQFDFHHGPNVYLEYPPERDEGEG